MIIIPARLDSTRFPRKILADIFGLPMVIASAKNAAKVDEVCVACDDTSVLELCQSHKIRALLTSKDHQSGTDRCYEAAKKLGLASSEIIINVQADEPFLEPEVLQALHNTMQQGAFMASCAKHITQTQALDPNAVKVVVDSSMNALYFSRSIIPYDRDATKLESSAQYLGHLGVYGYSMESLKEFCALPQSKEHSPLEHTEKLEQLRALYYGKRITMVLVSTQSIGIDTPEDLARALQYFGESS
ncbi:3-deoxy-manno-octulosonate cytidylyltransferase [Helicobacter sp.]|uniref:3-deoxy-manno-octulosonate cytidylyltransferase n=1 Tax=Helicobacter sp. TaxID=218 RepID=UPI0025C565D7|nr:3-deoxy-manno-octulosonate cytidylyltransferase [Helicobacter sp.]MBR2494343.1 3-deoxy-manno-octulosonate cytidylyltransferase [Helicobacter sp.]